MAGNVEYQGLERQKTWSDIYSYSYNESLTGCVAQLEELEKFTKVIVGEKAWVSPLSCKIGKLFADFTTVLRVNSRAWKTLTQKQIRRPTNGVDVVCISFDTLKSAIPPCILYPLYLPAVSGQNKPC